jgi:hypothetical protein
MNSTFLSQKKCDRCKLRRKSTLVDSMKDIATAIIRKASPEYVNMYLCEPCFNHVLHVSACKKTNKKPTRPDWQYLNDKRYKHDVVTSS